ncbi:MAG: hypothetical protein IJ600_08080 [Lachnospiraceae bacterium]|nr:hypothetical protein [Lachnospiraceae bacterium]
MIKWGLAGRLAAGTAAVGLGLLFGSALQPADEVQAAMLCTDVAVDLPGTEEGGSNTGSQAPTERNVTANLTENYNSDFNLYEESFNGRYVFYANIENGGMTADAVVMDIPSNLSYTLEKDGQAVAYNSGTAVQALGMYVLTIRVDETDSLGIVTHYQASFRFRIMEASQQVTDNPTTTTATGDPAGMGDISAELESQIGMRYEDLTPEEQAALDEFIRGEGTDVEILNPDGTVNQEKLDELVAGHMDEMGDINDIYVTEGISEITGISSVYDAVTGYYKNTLRSGQVFYTDVQNGTVTHLAVTLRGDDSLSYLVYKDGELYGSEDHSRFTEAGTYMLIPQSSDILFLDSYEEELPVFSFRIIDSAANDLSLLHLPEGFRVSGVYLDELPAESAKVFHEDTADTVYLREDGSYLVTFSNGEMEIELAYTLDRVKPRYQVNVQKNVAEIAYISQDVTSTEVYRNEQPYETKFDVVSRIDETGKYWLFVYDAAGNMSATAFDVRYGFNKGAVIALLIIAATVVGLFAYLRYLNTHVKVR